MEFDKVDQHAEDVSAPQNVSVKKSQVDAFNDNYNDPEDSMDPEDYFLDANSASGEDGAANVAAPAPVSDFGQNPAKVADAATFPGPDAGGTDFEEEPDDFQGSVERFDSVNEQFAPAVAVAILENSSNDVKASPGYGNDVEVPPNDVDLDVLQYVAPLSAPVDDGSLDSSSDSSSDAGHADGSSDAGEQPNGFQVDSNGATANGQVAALEAGHDGLPIEEPVFSIDTEGFYEDRGDGRNDAVKGFYQEKEEETDDSPAEESDGIAKSQVEHAENDGITETPENNEVINLEAAKDSTADSCESVDHPEAVEVTGLGNFGTDETETKDLSAENPEPLKYESKEEDASPALAVDSQAPELTSPSLGSSDIPLELGAQPEELLKDTPTDTEEVVKEPEVSEVVSNDKDEPEVSEVVSNDKDEPKVSEVVSNDKDEPKVSEVASNDKDVQEETHDGVNEKEIKDVEATNLEENPSSVASVAEEEGKKEDEKMLEQSVVGEEHAKENTINSEGSDQVDVNTDHSESSQLGQDSIVLPKTVAEYIVSSVAEVPEKLSDREIAEPEEKGLKEKGNLEHTSGDSLEEEETPKQEAIQNEDGSPKQEDIQNEDETPKQESAQHDTVETEESVNPEKVEGSESEKAQVIVEPVTNSKPSAPEMPSLGGAGPSLPARPAGLGRSIPCLDPAPRAIQRSNPNPTRPSQVPNEDNGSNTDISEGSEDAREKLQTIRVKFLRLAHRLGQSAHNVVVAQVLYRLGLAEQIRGGRGSGRTGTFSFERASTMAEELEAAGKDDLDFACTIMVLGKSGVGKSATINSLFDEVKSGTNAFSPATTKVQEITGTVHGIKLRVIDTPGLLSSFADQRRNERIMASVKRYIKKTPPDIVLYFDRLDMQSRDHGDLPLLRTITDTFGSAVWFNAIVVLTHASSAPPDGPNGVPVSYEMFVAQRSHVVQQTIRQAAGDMRLMNPVSLVENHTACRRNRSGERVLPNGQIWKPQLLLLCFASKILAEANSLLKLQDNTPAKPFGVRSRVPPLPFLLSSLLQSRAQLKHPDDQMGSDDESELDSDDDEDSDGEEYDDLPPFRRLRKDELKLLDKEQRNIYFEEIEYREKLFMKKQLKEERARKREMKRRLASLPKEVSQFVEESMEEENASAQVPVPMPDMALPPSFDSDNPTHRYRYLDSNNQWLVRPVLETHGWDHDSGYDGLNVEKMFVIAKKIPASVSGQVTKDKKEANLQMECAASFKSGKGKVTQAALDVQTIGKDLSYTLRSETRFINFKKNKTTLGFAVTLLGDTVAPGVKMENHLLVGKRLKLVVNGGALQGRGDVAYGGSLEATLRDKDYPIGQFLSTLGLSVMNWHGDLAVGGNLQVQFKVGKTMMVARGNLNNRRAGQISLRASSSEQLQMALIGIIPLVRTLINNRILNSN